MSCNMKVVLALISLIKVVSSFDPVHVTFHGYGAGSDGDHVSLCGGCTNPGQTTDNFTCIAETTIQDQKWRIEMHMTPCILQWKWKIGDDWLETASNKGPHSDRQTSIHATKKDLEVFAEFNRDTAILYIQQDVVFILNNPQLSANQYSVCGMCDTSGGRRPRQGYATWNCSSPQPVKDGKVSITQRMFTGCDYLWKWFDATNGYYDIGGMNNDRRLPVAMPGCAYEEVFVVKSHWGAYGSAQDYRCEDSSFYTTTPTTLPPTASNAALTTEDGLSFSTQQYSTESAFKGTTTLTAISSTLSSVKHATNMVTSPSITSQTFHITTFMPSFQDDSSPTSTRQTSYSPGTKKLGRYGSTARDGTSEHSVTPSETSLTVRETTIEDSSTASTGIITSTQSAVTTTRLLPEKDSTVDNTIYTDTTENPEITISNGFRKDVSFVMDATTVTVDGTKMVNTIENSGSVRKETHSTLNMMTADNDIANSIVKVSSSKGATFTPNTTTTTPYNSTNTNTTKHPYNTMSIGTRKTANNEMKTTNFANDSTTTETDKSTTNVTTTPKNGTNSNHKGKSDVKEAEFHMHISNILLAVIISLSVLLLACIVVAVLIIKRRRMKKSWKRGSFMEMSRPIHSGNRVSGAPEPLGYTDIATTENPLYSSGEMEEVPNDNVIYALPDNYRNSLTSTFQTNTIPHNYNNGLEPDYYNIDHRQAVNPLYAEPLSFP